MTVLFLFLLLFLLMFIGVPIAASLGLAGSITIMLFSPDSVRSLAIKLFETSEHYTLLAIPFFVLAGAIMAEGGMSRRLVAFAGVLVGFVRGGEAVMLRFDAYPYQKFGHTAGRVAQVARVALSSQDLSALGLSGLDSTGSGEPVYRITVDLAAQSIMAYGEARPLQIGMQLEADIMQERRKLYEWVLEPLISITGKL